MPIPFRLIASLLTRTLHPAPVVDLTEAEALLTGIRRGDNRQGVLITVNHYSAPDFQAWWFAILISTIFPSRVHWIVTSGWTNSGWLTRVTHWLFPRGARLLGFTAMPAMPPIPAEIEQRALAVRQVLHYAMHTDAPVVGMAPEGRDIPGGVLGSLPAGVGRFMYLLSPYCPIILPAGVWKDRGRINLKLGTPYNMDLTDGLLTHERDDLVGKIVMQHIASCLPVALRGDYSVKN